MRRILTRWLLAVLAVVLAVPGFGLAERPPRAAELTDLEPVGLVTGPSGTPFTCTGGSLVGEFNATASPQESGRSSARLWVPAGATATATGQVRNIQSIFGAVLPWSLNPFGSGNTNAGATTSVNMTWTNTSSQSRLIPVSFKADLTLFAMRYSWNISFSVNGQGGCLVDDAQLAVPNEAMPNGSCAQPGAADPVNVVQGNFWDSWTDVVIPGRGPGVSVARTYSSSRAGSDGPFGHGWSWSYGMRLAEDAGVVTITQESGAPVRFYELSAGVWSAPPGVHATLVENPGVSWTFTRSGVEVFTFDTAGRLTAVSDLSGNATTLSYTGNDLTGITDPAGRTVSVTWSSGRISQLDAPAVELEPGGSPVPVSVSYGYDGAGNLVSVTGPDGAVWAFGYDGAHRMTTVREPRHHALGSGAPVVENSYDSAGRVVWQEDRLDRRTTFDWGTPGQTTVTDPAGNVTVYEHERGVCTGIVRDPGPEESRWSFEVDQYTLGRTKVTDPNGVVTTTVFNSRGLPTSVTGPKGTTSLTYDPVTFLPTSVTDPSGVTTTYTYEPGSDRLSSVSRPITPGGGTWSMSLVYADPDDPASPSAITDPRDAVFGFDYDSAGNVVSASVPTDGTNPPLVTTWTYNAHGWPLTSVGPAGNAPGGNPAGHTTSWTYDPAGRVTATTDPEGATSEYGWDLSGLLAWVRDPVPAGDPAEETTFTWNAAGELTAVERPDGATLENEYWPDGALKVQRDPAGAETLYAYDQQGRLSSVTDPAGRVTGYRHDPAGRVIAEEQPGGDCDAPTPVGCVTYEYTAAGELESIEYSDPATSDVAFTYDALGRRETMSDQAGTTSFTWDSLGRLLAVADPVAGTVSYGYSDAGPQATSVTYPGGKTVQRSFDLAGRAQTVTAWTGGTVGFDYDTGSNLASVDTAATTGVERTFSHDRLGRFTGTGLHDAIGTLATLDYTRDPEGMVTETLATGLPGTDTYGYDPQDRIATDNTGGYSFDLAGNLTGFPDGRQQRYGPGNQLCYQALTNTADCAAPPVGATSFDYDERGNRVVSQPDGGIPTVYGYDQADRLVEATVPSVAGGEGQLRVVEPVLVARSSPAAGTCAPGPCGPIAAGSTVQVKATGVGAVPADGVRAVVLNVHAQAPAVGQVTVHPTGTAASTTSLMLNAGQWATNTVVVPVDQDGRVAVTATGTTANVTLSVTGWYPEPDTTTTSGGGFTFEPLPNPTRLVDTTSGTGPCTPAPCARLGAGGITTLQITGHAGVPATGVSAVAVHLHAVYPAGTGFLTAYPTGPAVPATATLAYQGLISSGFAIVPVDANGRIDLYTFQATDLVVDVLGWYTAPTSGDGLVAHALDGTTVADTAAGTGTCDPAPCARLTGGQPITITATGVAGIPSDADAVALVVHTINPATPGVLTVWPTGQPVPDAATLGYRATGARASGTTIVPVGPDGTITVQASAATDLIIQAAGWYDTATQTWSYTYDGDGLRRTKTSPNGTTTTFTWDRASGLPLLIAETIDAPGTSNDRTIRYVHGPTGVLADITEPAAGGTETLRWYHQDQLGSTVALTDTTGQIIGTASYRPYGQPDHTTGQTTPIGWAGEYRDDETGLVYLRARYYDPSTGQFLTRDPLAAVSRNPYGYAWNNPVNITDPTGQLPFLAVGLAIWGAVDAYNTLTDDCASGLAKVLAIAGALPSGKAIRNAGKLLDATRARQTTLYRAVSSAEADDIARHGFRQAPSGRSYEGKLFATSAEDAARYGRINYGIDGKPFHIVEARVPSSFARSLYSDTADSMRYVAVDRGGQLARLNRLARVNIWDHVPWVAKP